MADWLESTMVKRTCTSSECHREAVSKGMCKAHYMRWRRHGDGYVRPTAEQRFWSHVARGRPDDCWEWTGYRHRQGYGWTRNLLGDGARDVYAHRLAFRLTHGYLPPVVRHTCDNPPCVNPAHLLPGTQQSNMADAVQRGRTSKGPHRPGAKLTEESVRAIRQRRAAGERACDLAAEFNVSSSLISNIVARRFWRHI